MRATEAIAFFAGKGSTAASKQLYKEGQTANVITGGTVDILRLYRRGIVL